jgi:two-component system chemotaxis sensor kinase CheA
MALLFEELSNNIESIALEIVMLDSADIPAIGNLLNLLSDFEKACHADDQQILKVVAGALKKYLEKVALREEDDLNPLEEGVDCLQSICRALVNDQEWEGDLGGLFEKLGQDLPGEINLDSKQKEEFKQAGIVEDQDGSGNTESLAAGYNDNEMDQGHEEEPAENGKENASLSGSGGENIETGPMASDLDEDEIEIVEDFVAESEENLCRIEVSLMDLEQNPGDVDIINTIFRPFHTIKGVSGFLNLNRINKLAHSAENLLDKARSGEIRVEGATVDIILAAVDMLKKMVADVRDGLEQGGALDNGIDIFDLKKQIDDIISQADQSGDKPLGQILVDRTDLSRENLAEALNSQKEQPDKKIGQILLESGKVESKQVVAALREQKKIGKKHVDFNVKVDTKKLDDLVDMAGELVIVQSMLRENISELSISEKKLFQNLGHLKQIASGLQNTAMSMRMVPVKQTFQKMVRLVRDLARHSGKEVALVMTGEDTEIDRNVVEELYDPMVHMIRNALDHGVEFPDEREAAGKDKKGTVHLKAYHKSGNVVIEIEDDGKGLSKERILEKAREKNLISEDERLPEQEIFNLIFEAGFSTAKEVTDISGRGVGMDVVRKSIEKLRGRVEINSRPGRGSTFMINLPLTMAIIDGMVVMIGEERFIIPTLSIMKSFRPDKEQCATVQGKGEIILSQGRLIPLVRLDHAFGIRGRSINPWEGLVVTVQHEGDQMCLMLDELLGKEEVIIKSLGEGFKDVKGIAGGAIMGDGRVGLILDVPGVFEVARGEGPVIAH